MPCFAPHIVSVMTPVNSPALAAVKSPAKMSVKQMLFISDPFLSSNSQAQAVFALPEPETNKDVAADRTRAVIRRDRIGQLINREVGADPGLDMTEQIDIPCVAESVSSDSKCAAVEDVEMLFQ